MITKDCYETAVHNNEFPKREFNRVINWQQQTCAMRTTTDASEGLLCYIVMFLTQISYTLSQLDCAHFSLRWWRCPHTMSQTQCTTKPKLTTTKHHESNEFCVCACVTPSKHTFRAFVQHNNRKTNAFSVPFRFFSDPFAIVEHEVDHFLISNAFLCANATAFMHALLACTPVPMMIRNALSFSLSVRAQPAQNRFV